MNAFSGAVPTLKILASFVCMLAGLRLRLGLWPSILAGSLVLALAFGMAPAAWASTAAAALVQGKTLLLAAIVTLILVLSDLLDRTGQSGRQMEALSRFLRHPRLRLIFFPALIGFLPMPGGAVFSAPMVRDMAQRLGVSSLDKALVNYWFRHVWETMWPLYPGVILAASLAGVSVPELMALTWPAPLVCLALGWVFILRPGRLPLRPEPGAAPDVAPPDGRRALIESVPLLLSIAGSIGLQAALGVLAPAIPSETGVLAGLALAILWTMVQNRVPASRLPALLTQKSLLSMLAVVGAIFVFKDVLAGTGAVEQTAAMAGGPAALALAAVFLPFLVGMVSGITMAFVGATFPLLLGLLSQLGLEDQKMAYVTMGMFSGFTGVMVSPLHICFVLTCQFFGVDLARAWKRVVWPCALVLAFGLAYGLALR